MLRVVERLGFHADEVRSADRQHRGSPRRSPRRPRRAHRLLADRHPDLAQHPPTPQRPTDAHPNRVREPTPTTRESPPTRYVEFNDRADAFLFGRWTYELFADYLEDPHDFPEIARRPGDHLDRVSYDAPIPSADDIGATPLAARVVNVKPSRIGSVPALLEVDARFTREQRAMYGGGMGELGVGRGQIELLAAMFHPDALNNVCTRLL